MTDLPPHLGDGVELTWAGRDLRQARLRLPGDGWLRLSRTDRTLPLLGRCDALAVEGEAAPRAHFSTVDYADPKRIPPLDRPTNLPRGGGTAVLNMIAGLAQRAGRATLRYRGPYPTGALFDALLESFRLAEAPPAAFARFRAEVEEAALAGEAVEPAVDFTPAPFLRAWPAPGVCVQRRDGRTEKVYLGDRDYRSAYGARRLWSEGDRTHAGWWIGGQPVVTLLTLAPDGALRDGPRPFPTAPPARDPLPPKLQSALGEALADRAPTLLRPALRDLLARAPLRWGAPEADLIEPEGEVVLLHGALAAPLAAATPDQAFTDLVLLIEPTLQRIARRRVRGG